jgi:hypothetical protein
MSSSGKAGKYGRKRLSSSFGKVFQIEDQRIGPERVAVAGKENRGRISAPQSWVP